MKQTKRYLRPSIEKALVVITIVLFCFVGCIDDFEPSFTGTYITLWVIVLFNIHILSKYGKGVWLENDND